MASIIETLKRVAVSVFDPKRYDESQELRYLQEIYYNKGGNLRPHQWYRLLGESGNCVGFSYVCGEGQEFKLLSAFEWFRDYHCPNCKDKFNLLQFAGIDPSKTPVNQWQSILAAKLPARPGISGKKTPGSIDTWGNDNGTVGYEPSVPNFL